MYYNSNTWVTHFDGVAKIEKGDFEIRDAGDAEKKRLIKDCIEFVIQVLKNLKARFPHTKELLKLQKFSILETCDNINGESPLVLSQVSLANLQLMVKII